MNIEAIFNDGTPCFRYPFALRKGEIVHAVIRTLKMTLKEWNYLFKTKGLK